MITIQKYNKKHLNIVKDLHKSHNWTYLQLLDIEPPKTGYIVYKSNKPVAAGFLRMIEGKYCKIDTLVTDAKAPASDRHECLSKLVETLINTAKAKKLKGIMAVSIDSSTIMRACKVGFTISQHAVLVMPLIER